MDKALVGSGEFWKALEGYGWPWLALGGFVRFQFLPDMSKKLEGATMVPMARPGQGGGLPKGTWFRRTFVLRLRVCDVSWRPGSGLSG